MSLHSDFILNALAHHEKSCNRMVRAIRVNPQHYAEIGDEVLGVKVVADSEVARNRLRIDCDGHIIKETVKEREEVAV